MYTFSLLQSFVVNAEIRSSRLLKSRPMNILFSGVLKQLFMSLAYLVPVAGRFWRLGLLELNRPDTVPPRLKLPQSQCHPSGDGIAFSNAGMKALKIFSTPESSRSPSTRVFISGSSIVLRRSESASESVLGWLSSVCLRGTKPQNEYSKSALWAALIGLNTSWASFRVTRFTLSLLFFWFTQASFRNVVYAWTKGWDIILFRALVFSLVSSSFTYATCFKSIGRPVRCIWIMSFVAGLKMFS